MKPWLKVFFSIGITGCVMSIIYAWIVDYEAERRMVFHSGAFNLLFVGAGTISVYVVISMIVRKKRHVWEKNVKIPALATAVALVGIAACLQWDVIGFEKWTPQLKDIEVCEIRAFCSAEGIRELSKEEVVDIHKKCIAQRKDWLAKAEGRQYDMDIIYRLKNGRVVTRRYPVFYTKKESQRADSVVATLERYYGDYQKMIPEMTQWEWLDIELDHSSVSGESFSVPLAKLHISLTSMKNAIQEDISEGTLKVLYLDEEEAQDKADKVVENNTMTLHFKGENDAKLDFAAVTRCAYVDYMPSVSEEDKRNGGYLVMPFTSRCRHIMKLLKEAGVTKKMLENETRFPAPQ